MDNVKDKAMATSVKIVLVGTTHPGNIGAAARALKTMGLKNLLLVAPQCDPYCEQAYSRAKGGSDVLGNALVVDSLDQAVGDCHIVIGTADRQRDIQTPLNAPRQWIERYKPYLQQQNIAVIFGPESHGLNNNQLQQCHYHWQIPTADDYHSLNLAAAVQVIAYEWSQYYLTTAYAKTKIAETNHDRQFITWQARQQCFQTIISWIEAHPFYNKQPATFEKRLQTLLKQALNTQQDIDFLMGLIKAIKQQGG